jgi:hypothetical protein
MRAEKRKEGIKMKIIFVNGSSISEWTKNDIIGLAYYQQRGLLSLNQLIKGIITHDDCKIIAFTSKSITVEGK